MKTENFSFVDKKGAIKQGQYILKLAQEGGKEEKGKKEKKQLELNGVGFRMAVNGQKLVMALGFSHPVEMAIPEGLEAKVENNVMTISGIDKQKVGEFAAVVRKKKPVEPYKGKGFRYVGEVVRRKEGKKAAA